MPIRFIRSEKEKKEETPLTDIATYLIKGLSEQRGRKEKIADELELYKEKLKADRLLGRKDIPTAKDLETIIQPRIGMQVEEELPMNLMGKIAAGLTPWATTLEKQRTERGKELYKPYLEESAGQFITPSTQSAGQFQVAPRAPATQGRIVGQFEKPSIEQDVELRQQAIQALQEIGAPATEANIREAIKQLQGK